MKRKLKLDCPPVLDCAKIACAPSPPIDNNEVRRRIAKLEGMYATAYDTWFEGCDQVRTLIGAEISRLRLGVRY